MSNCYRTPASANNSGEFTAAEFAAAIQNTKPGKAPEPYSMSGIDHTYWSCLKANGFLSSCVHHLRIPKVWRRAFVVAIIKPSKTRGDPKIYHPISLLCVSCKILETLIQAHAEPIIDLLLPTDQDKFWRRRSTVDQAVLLTQNNNDYFET